MTVFLSGDEVVLFSPSPLCSSKTRGSSRYRQGRGGLAVTLSASDSTCILVQGRGQLPNPTATGGMWMQMLETAQGEQVTHTLNLGPFSVGSPASFTPAGSSVPHPGLSAALVALSQGFEVSPAFCSRWHSLVLFQALSFWNFLWENLF